MNSIIITYKSRTSRNWELSIGSHSMSFYTLAEFSHTGILRIPGNRVIKNVLYFIIFLPWTLQRFSCFSSKVPEENAHFQIISPWPLHTIIYKGWRDILKTKLEISTVIGFFFFFLLVRVYHVRRHIYFLILSEKIREIR